MKRTERLTLSMRWLARLISLAVLGLVLAILIGEGGFNSFQMTPVETVQMISFWTACMGRSAGGKNSPAGC